MRYLEPTTLDEALAALAEHGDDAKVIAGGQSLLILMRERLVDPEVLIGLQAIPELRVLQTDGEATIGATVRHGTVERDAAIARGWPLVAAAEAAVSTLQVRNRGTLCGSVAHAFPTADPPGALIASHARIRLASQARGEREVAAEDFFLGLLETAAEPDELVTAVRLPAQPAGARTAYLKFSIRPLDFAIVGVAVRVLLAGDATIAEARIGLNGAANRTLRATGAEAVLAGQTPSEELLRAAAQAARRGGATGGRGRRSHGHPRARGAGQGGGAHLSAPRRRLEFPRQWASSAGPARKASRASAEAVSQPKAGRAMTYPCP